jgi:lipid A 3-O-deacylase
MRLLLRPASLLPLFFLTALDASELPEKPWETHAIGLESGLLWQVGKNTPISYRLVPAQLSWRTPQVFGYDFANESRLLVRNRFALFGYWVQHGPESYYAAINASPSIEWWNEAGTWSLFTGAGGGLGLTDSRGVEGGQGQDFTFHWFARGGIEHLVSPSASISAGILFLHVSNRGMTDPNPGIDALGLTLGYSRRF